MADQQPGDPHPAAELPDTRIDGGRGQPTADVPARWSGAAAVPPPMPRRRWWSRRGVGPRPIEHTAIDPDDWASIPAVDPWAGQDTGWDDLLTVSEEPLPPTAVDRPPTAVEPPAARPAGPAEAAPPAAGSASVPPRPPRISWWERWARERAPLEREVRERAARQREVMQRAAQHRATQMRESMARAANSAPPLVSRLPVQPRPSATPAPGPTRPGSVPTGPTGRGSVPAGPTRPGSVPAGPTRPGSVPPGPARQARERPLPPPLRPRRRRRRLVRLTLFGLLLCVGLPVAYERIPGARQYPVTADLPKSFLDLSRRDDNASKLAARRLAAELGADDAEADVFAGVYGDGRGKRVTVFGVTGWRFTPGRDAQTQLEQLAAEFAIGTVTAFDLGEPGAHELCGTGRANGAGVVVCTWADHGSLGAVLLTRRSLDESADLVGRLRSEVLA